MVFLATLLPVHAEEPFLFATTPGQLPKSIVPEDYTLHIMPNVDLDRFTGVETVRMRVLQPTDRIVLNAVDLEFQSASLSGATLDNASMALAPVLDAEKQTLSFVLPRTLDAGAYRLEINYSGKIDAKAQGLYYDKYPTATGDKKMLATQMEPTSARRMMPAWDEPVFRASFKLSVDVPANFQAYSNMPVERSEPQPGGLQRITFGRTPKMASYLVVLVAGEFERLSSKLGTLDLGIVTTEGKLPSAHYAMASTKQILGYYNQYFGIGYPLPKLDQMAIPGGFSGAMENWGGITYNDTTLLFDQATSSDQTRQRVFGIVAHEIAHQWFGDLVTMAWWDNLWLNEGFASWMGTKVTDHFNPEWKIALKTHRDRENAMELDARATSHPIQQPVKTESQASDAFDEITYLKSQSFLRMLEAYLGEDIFRAGIRAYMAEHQYSSTTTANLWSAVEKASDKPVSKIVADWTSQPGFPLISVDSVCKNGIRNITLGQAQFRVDTDAPGTRLWMVPIAIGYTDANSTGDAGGSASDYLLLKERSTTIKRKGCERTLVIDPDSVGYFRIQYSPKMLKSLGEQFSSLAPGVRLRLLSDTWALAGVGRVALATYFNLLAKLGKEPEFSVWRTVIGHLESLDSMAQNEAVRPALRRYAIGLLLPKFRQVGWDLKSGESFGQRELRPSLISILGKFGDLEVVSGSQTRFQRFLLEPSSLHPSVATAVIGVAGRHADQKVFNALDSLAQKALTTEEKNRYYYAMFSAADPSLADQALRMALSDQTPQLISTQVVAAVAGSGEHLQQAWAYAKANGDALIGKVFSLARNHYFGNVVSNSSDPTIADDLEAFVMTKLSTDAMTETRRISDRIRQNAKRKALLLPQADALLKAVHVRSP